MKSIQDKLLSLEVKLRNAMSSEILESSSEQQVKKAWQEYRESVSELTNNSSLIRETLLEYLQKEMQTRSLTLFEEVTSGETLYYFDVEKIEKSVEEIRAIRQTIDLINATKFKVKWTHKVPELSLDEKKVIEEEIKLLNEDLDSASDLIFHSIPLTKNMKGALVMVHGEEEVKDTLFLTYYSKPEWTTISTVI